MPTKWSTLMHQLDDARATLEQARARSTWSGIAKLAPEWTPSPYRPIEIQELMRIQWELEFTVLE